MKTFSSPCVASCKGKSGFDLGDSVPVAERMGRSGGGRMWMPAQQALPQRSRMAEILEGLNREQTEQDFSVIREG